MCKKALFVSLSLLFFQFVPVCFAEVKPAIQVAQSRILSLIDANNFTAADIAVKQMKVNFADNTELPKRLCRIAYKYEQVEALNQAKSLNAQIAANFPGQDAAKFAGLQFAKLNIYDSIDRGDYDSVDSAISRMVTDFKGNENLPRRLWEVANRFDKAKAFKYAKTLSSRIAADYPNDTYAKYASLLAAKLKIYEMIDAGNYESANSAVAAMIKDFADHKQLSRRLYEIAQRYSDNQAWAYAKQLHGRIAASYPNDKYGSRAAIRQSKLKVYELINAGDYEAADKALLKMKTDFAGHGELYSQLSDIGERYEFAGQTENAKKVYQRIIKDCPDNKKLAFVKARLKKYDVITAVEFSGDYNSIDNAAKQFRSEFAVPEQRCAAMFYLAKGLYEKAITSPDQNDAKITNYLKRIIAIQENEVVGRIGRGSMEQEAYLILAAAYERLGRYDKSIEYYNKVLNDYPGYEYAWHVQFMVGQNYEEMLQAGQISQPQAMLQIKTAYQKVLLKYPDCKAAKLAKKWLDRNGN